MHLQKLLRVYKKLELIDGILYKTSSHDCQQIKQIVLPKSLREVALRDIHDDVGHPGKDKTLWLAKQRYYWPGMEYEINQKVESCGRCISSKTPVRHTAELVPIVTTKPMELHVVCIDLLSLEQSKGGYENILHFTRFVKAIACKNQTAHTTYNIWKFLSSLQFPREKKSENRIGILSRKLLNIFVTF